MMYDRQGYNILIYYLIFVLVKSSFQILMPFLPGDGFQETESMYTQQPQGSTKHQKLILEITGF